MKREMNDENDTGNSGGGGGGGGNKRSRRNEDVVRLLIPSRIAGAVIGKGGQHIQKMRSQYKATVSVDDCPGPERTILISSDVESVLNTIKEMLKYFEEKDNEVDVRMLIHQSLAGCVIGKGGSKIKEIRDKVGCRILKVFSNVAPQSTDRIVQIIGKQEQCVNAVQQVLEVTRDTPIKGSVHNYDPINFDDIYADEYGGYGGMQNGGGGGMGGGMRGGDRQSRFDRRDGGRRFGGGGGGDRGRRDDRSRSGGRRDREYINPWASDGPIGGGPGNMGSSGGFGGNMGGGFGGSGGGFGGGGSGGGFGGGGSTGGFGGGSGGGFGGSGGGFGPSGGTTFGSSSGGGGSFGSGPGGNFGGNSGGGFGGGSGMGGNNLGNGLGGGMGGGNMGGGNMGNSGGGGGFGGGMNNGGPGGDNKNSTQVTIPKDLAGAIIGKGGGRIRRIRNESGAYITIDEPLPGSNDRIITISGSPKQIQMAQYLLQQRKDMNELMLTDEDSYQAEKDILMF